MPIVDFHRSQEPGIHFFKHPCINQARDRATAAASMLLGLPGPGEFWKENPGTDGNQSVQASTLSSDIRLPRGCSGHSAAAVGRSLAFL